MEVQIMERRKQIQYLIEIAESAIEEPYVLGTNDCNLMVLEWIDLLCGTDYISVGRGKYSTIAEGLKLFKSIGHEGIESIIQKHGELTEYPIIGDVLIDQMNTSLVLQGTYVSLNHDTLKFEVRRLSDLSDVQFYRIK